MGRFNDFGATNKPDTCKWCGKKLRQKAWVKKEGTGKYRPPKSCAYCHAEKPKWTVSDDCPDKELGQWFRCGECGTDSYGRQIEKTVSRELVHDKRGDYGDGHFCGLRCGYDFAVRQADLGAHFAPVKK